MICVQLGRGVWLAMRMCHDHWWYAARIDIAVCLLALFHPLLLLTLLACPGYVCRARWLTVLCQFVIAPYNLTCPFASSTTVALLNAFFALKIHHCCRKYTLMIDWLQAISKQVCSLFNFLCFDFLFVGQICGNFVVIQKMWIITDHRELLQWGLTRHLQTSLSLPV